MHLSLPFRHVPTLLTATLLAALLAMPAHAEPSDHATTPDLDLSGPSIAAPQDGLSSQPEPVYPNGEPDLGATESDDGVETVESDETDEEQAAPASPIVIANIDKAKQEMTVFVDGVETYTWPVSTGIGGYSTPSGTFTASSMNKIWYSKQWDNAPMPHAVFFTKKGHAIHGTNDVKHLGKPASHGCVRLSPENAETFFNLVKESGLENTEVVLTGVTPGGEYKVTQPQPQRQERQYRGRDRYFDRYGYYEEQPQVQRQRRRLFQPYYQAPPPQYQEQPRRRRWFFRN